jgi:membrane protein required for colicin V production
VTIFDYLVLFILLSSIVISLMRGLLKEILSLAGWIIAFFVANAYSVSLSHMLPDKIPGTILPLIAAFVILFIGVRLLVSLFSTAIGALVSASDFSLADRGLGGLFGLARGVIIVWALVLLCEKTAIPQQDFWKKAVLRPIVEVTIRTIEPLLPGEFIRKI